MRGYTSPSDAHGRSRLWAGRAAVRSTPLGEEAYDTYAKVNPPLRARPDMNAMAQGLADGVIDIIATDHAPHGRVEKLSTFEDAAMGISVLETAFASTLSLVHDWTGRIFRLVVEKLTSAPSRNCSDARTSGRLRPGSPRPTLTIFDPDAEWVVDTERVRVQGEEFAAARRDAEGASRGDAGGGRGGV